MHRPAAVIGLTAEEEIKLKEWSRKETAELRLVERLRVILLTSQGKTTRQIADQLHTRTARVSKWRQRFAAGRLDGLADAPRSGKPAKYDARTEKRVLTQLDEAPPRGYGGWNGNRLAEVLGDVQLCTARCLARQLQIEQVSILLPR